MRAIDADTLIGDLHNYAFLDGDDRSICYNVIQKQPTIEPERKKGEWTKDNSCPFCGFLPWYERDIHTLSFCSNYGADMRGEQE